MTALFASLFVGIVAAFFAVISSLHHHDRLTAFFILAETAALWYVGRFLFNALGG